MPAVLREEPQLRLLFGGQVLSIVGDRVMLVALPFAVLEAGGGLGAVGLVVTPQLPFLVFALVGGVLSDRGERRRVLIASDLARMVVQGTGGVLLVTGAATPLRLGASRCSTGRPRRSSCPRSPGCCPRPSRTPAGCSPPTRCAR